MSRKKKLLLSNYAFKTMNNQIHVIGRPSGLRGTTALALKAVRNMTKDQSKNPGPWSGEPQSASEFVNTFPNSPEKPINPPTEQSPLKQQSETSQMAIKIQ